MSMRAVLVALTCVAVIGCATEGDLDRQSARYAPAEPMALTIEGYGTFTGRAEYDVSEPSGDIVPTSELVLSGVHPTGETVTLRLGQQRAGAVEPSYAFPARDHAFLVQIDGLEYEGRFGTVTLDEQIGRLSGTFELSSTDLSGQGEKMLTGSFEADELHLNCNRLVHEASTGAGSPGQSSDGSELTWTPDTHLKSAFCAAMRDTFTEQGF